MKIELNNETIILTIDGQINRPTFTVDGYVYFSVKGERFALHRIVAQYFLNNGKPIDGLDVHHKDFSRDNNAADNLMILTKQQHAAIHRYLETPEGYRKLNEDIEEWKRKADYYRKKAQKIEKLNNQMETYLKKQCNLLERYADAMNKIDAILNDKIKEIGYTDDKKTKYKYEIYSDESLKEISGENEIKEVINECMNKYGKVTRKKLFLCGVKNFDSVYHLYFMNKEKYK